MDSSDFTIAGIGGAGCRVLGTLKKTPGAEKVKLLAIDTDRDSLTNTGLAPENTLLAGEKWRRGLGCGGSVSDGKNAVGSARAAIAGMLAGTKMLLVTGGLGGGTATGGMSIVLSVAAGLKIPCIALTTLPFSHEGNQRRRLAVTALDEDIHSIADAVITLPNDLLFSVLAPTTPVAAAYKMADEQIARTALALSELLCSGNLLNADFASFSALLKRQKNHCAIGVGISGDAQGGLRTEKAFEAMLNSPLLGGASKLQEADAVIFNLLGGEDLSIGDVQNIFNLGSRFIRQDAVLLSSASTSAAWQGLLQFTAVAIKFDHSAKMPDISKRQAKTPIADDSDSLFGNTAMEQPVLPFTQISKGIMESTQKVIWKGEDLDIPTCIRHNEVIDSGKKVPKQ